uniref:Uncharacterized protein n=1 Tax=Cacopsylla melanoneura TaxID=428564 RepID=A0A8D8VLC7_9HEMI
MRIKSWLSCCCLHIILCQKLANIFLSTSPVLPNCIPGLLILKHGCGPDQKCCRASVKELPPASLLILNFCRPSFTARAHQMVIGLRPLVLSATQRPITEGVVVALNRFLARVFCFPP